MISAVVILYHGAKPSQDAMRRVVEELASLNCCNEVIDVKHLDECEIAKAIVGKASEVPENLDKTPSFVVEFITGDAKIQTVKALKEYLGITLKEAKDAVDTGHITLHSTMPIELLTTLFDNGVIFTKAPEEYLIENAIYLLNKRFSGNDGLFSLVKYLQEYEAGERSSIHRAVHEAVDLLYQNKDSMSARRLNSGLYDMIRAWKKRN